MKATWLTLLLCAANVTGCEQKADKTHTRSEAVASASLAMSGPSLLSLDRLKPALAALQSRSPGKLLRLEIRAAEVTLQAEDASTKGSVIELHYRDGKVGEPEPAAVRGKGRLSDNLFDLADVKLDAIPELTREAVRRVDAESGNVDVVLVRRNLPDTDDVRVRVYVSSPRQSGYLDADRAGQPL
jgi:hypothetical protein